MRLLGVDVYDVEAHPWQNQNKLLSREGEAPVRAKVGFWRPGLSSAISDVFVSQGWKSAMLPARTTPEFGQDFPKLLLI
jgi:hypothetical protein